MTRFRDVLPAGLADDFSDQSCPRCSTSTQSTPRGTTLCAAMMGSPSEFQVWRNSWYELEGAVQALPDVSTARPDGSLVLRIGAIRLHTYKVGNTEELNIHNVRISGTVTKDRIVHSNLEQLQLFSKAPEATGPLNLVLAHAGNPFDGLCAVYVGAPTQDEAGPSWYWVESLFRIPPDEVRRDQPIPEGPVTPYSDLPVTDFDLTLKPEPDEEQPSSDQS